MQAMNGSNERDSYSTIGESYEKMKTTLDEGWYGYSIIFMLRIYLFELLRLLSENHLLYRSDEYSLCSKFLQLADYLPEAFLVEHGVDRAPVVISQRNDGGTLQSGQHFYYGSQTCFRSVHPHVFLVHDSSPPQNGIASG